MANRLYVIGIGYKPLDKRAKEIILNSEVILANNRLLEVFKEYEEYETVKDKVKVINNVDETIAFIKSCPQSVSASPLHPFTHSPIVLLASGDPMFFGIGRRAVREFGKEEVEIIPDLSSIQLAFSRIKEAWDDAFLMSLHGGPDPEKRRRLPYKIKDIPSLLERHNKIAILTDKENNPQAIARELLKHYSPIHPSTNSPIKIFVCERLGYPDERIIEDSPEEIAKRSFRDPNVVILKVNESEVRMEGIIPEEIKFGLTEGEIIHSRGLITKDEIRAIVIHKLRLPQRGLFWDIGSGSGSISIEAARLFPFLKVFAIEKDPEQLGHILDNKKKFNVPNVEIIKGEAPDVLKDLPVPDRIFIGGSGGRLKKIMESIDQLKARSESNSWSGILVINATTLETLNMAHKLLVERNYHVDILQVQISRLKPLGDRHHLSAQNPVFIISAEKQGT